MTPFSPRQRMTSNRVININTGLKSGILYRRICLKITMRTQAVESESIGSHICGRQQQHKYVNVTFDDSRTMECMTDGHSYHGTEATEGSTRPVWCSLLSVTNVLHLVPVAITVAPNRSTCSYALNKSSQDFCPCNTLLTWPADKEAIGLSKDHKINHVLFLIVTHFYEILNHSVPGHTNTTSMHTISRLDDVSQSRMVLWETDIQEALS